MGPDNCASRSMFRKRLLSLPAAPVAAVIRLGLPKATVPLSNTVSALICPTALPLVSTSR